MSATRSRKPAATEPATKVEPKTNGGRPAVEEDDDNVVLRVSTLKQKRATVIIETEEHPDGYAYELAQMRDFGVGEQQHLSRDGEEYRNLWGKRITNKEEKRLKMLLDRMFDKVLLAPAKVKAQCDDEIRGEVVTAFTFAPLMLAARKEKEDAEDKAKTQAEQEAENESMDRDEDETNPTTES